MQKDAEQCNEPQSLTLEKNMYLIWLFYLCIRDQLVLNWFLFIQESIYVPDAVISMSIKADDRQRVDQLSKGLRRYVLKQYI